MCAPSRPPEWSAKRWSHSSWPMPRSRNSGAIRWKNSKRTTLPTATASPPDSRSAEARNTEPTEGTENSSCVHLSVPRPISARLSADYGARLLHLQRTMSRLNELTSTIIGAVIEVHRSLGPGLLESAYETCLAFELVDRGLSIEREKPLPMVYRGRRLDCGYRIDLIVEDEIIVEVKAVEQIMPVHSAQLLSYLRLYRR